MKDLLKSYCIILLLGFIVFGTPTYGESPSCLLVYKEGGAPAVFSSPKCPRWKLSSFVFHPQTSRCQIATHQGRRKYQEDRTICVLDVRIPFPGPAGLTDVAVGIMAVFDGHNGAEASDMASKLLLEYFILHTYFLIDTTIFLLSKKPLRTLPDNGEVNPVFQAIDWNGILNCQALDDGRFKLILSAISGGSLHLEILKESLLKALHDIDVTFSKEASRDNLLSGSTAAVILKADDQILVANVGDSKAILCSENFQSVSEAKATLLKLYRQRRQNGVSHPIKYSEVLKLAASNELVHFSATELTRDHHPDRDDERSRVQSAGGEVLEWAGVPRVNGQLAVSRAIGDIYFKSYGVVSTPEVTEWQPLTSNDSYLVAASDGIFEKQSPQDVCDLLWEFHTHNASCSNSLADCIVNTALEKGSTDNLATVVVPLRSSGIFRMNREKRIDHLPFNQQNSIDGESELAHAHPVSAKFDRLLVERKHGALGCFYLSENLDENADSTFWVQKIDQLDMYDLPPALPGAPDWNGPLNVYKDYTMCYDFGMTANEGNDRCVNPEGFAGFLGFLGSIPIHNIESEYRSDEHAMPDSRYILKKRFGRGAFGEVWLASYWNCTEENNATRWVPGNRKCASDSASFNNHNRDSRQNSSGDQFTYVHDDLYILKRIMVEKGTNVYLSGLREKHFGELFLNASSSLGGSLSTVIRESVMSESQTDLYDLPERNGYVAEDLKTAWNSASMARNRNRMKRVPSEEGLNHIARYLESFESRSSDMWLVFRHEGVSLSKVLYTAEEVKNHADVAEDEHPQHAHILHPSKWWHWLKTTEAGQEEMRVLMRQLLLALKSCHGRNIIHRDIKPENMVICFEDQDSGKCLKGIPSGDKTYTTKMRIIDFGSAMDMFTLSHLYGSTGPSRAEQTYENTPPEALLNASWYRGPVQTTSKYDMWSAGVVFLEMILGLPDVFQISALTQALLDRHLEGWNDDLRELAHKLRSLMELCILIPGRSPKIHGISGANSGTSGSPASWKCSEEYFSQQIRSRDPLKIGFPNVQALRLARQLLAWDPDDRPSVDEALQHPYFHPNRQK